LQKNLKTLHMCENICNIQMKTLANICLENEVKHLKHTLETYVHRHSNMCNIPIYFCNIQIKHLKHLKHTLATCAFSKTW